MFKAVCGYNYVSVPIYNLSQSSCELWVLYFNKSFHTVTSGKFQAFPVKLRQVNVLETYDTNLHFSDPNGNKVLPVFMKNTNNTTCKSFISKNFQFLKDNKVHLPYFSKRASHINTKLTPTRIITGNMT